ncbi:hypothetical protein Y032_0001g108 [Ancylostoma ceylanicum]|uniref:Uncharacterized protein n=1 Tax=Ancylostoma ceylanicum TaxID=53326 RepID=A0A016W3E0_9BILA|nr:hypothetical protein Y032_0001g108 [Ancylostoma ceylanicum]
MFYIYQNVSASTTKEIIEAYTTMKTFIVLLALSGLAASWAPCPKMDSITEEDMKKSHFGKVFRNAANTLCEAKSSHD